MYDLFISYARKELAIVQPFVDDLQSQGYQVFHDVSGIDGGTSFPDVISDAIDNSALVVAFWSSAYFTRPWCLIEAREGLSSHKLVPIMIEQFERNAPPADLRYVNYYSFNTEHDLQHPDWTRVLNAITERLSRVSNPGGALRSDLSLEPSRVSDVVSVDKSVDESTRNLEDLRRTWRRFPNKDNVAAVEQFAAFVRQEAAGSGLQFEVELHLKTISSNSSGSHIAPRLSNAIARARTAAIADRPLGERCFGLDLEGVKDWANPQLVVLPPGAFVMGGSISEPLADEPRMRELPQHTVHIDYSLAMGIHPVTVREFGAFIAETGYNPERGAFGINRKRYPNRAWPYNQNLSWKSPGFLQTATNPVVCVNSFDISAYLEWLNARLGLTEPRSAYRLPSESEWEYACRAGTATSYSFGDKPEAAFARFFDPEVSAQSRKIKNAKGTVEVGRFPPNPFGVKDMHGNIWEMCQDWWNENYHGAPVDGSAWLSGDPSRRVTRGGSWASPPDRLRSRFRGRVDTGSRFDFLGFRIVRTLV